MNVKELYKVIALTYCARVQDCGDNDKAAKNLLLWLNNMGCIDGQISNYPNAGNGVHGMSNALYKAGLENDEVYNYLHSLSKPLVLHSLLCPNYQKLNGHKCKGEVYPCTSLAA